ncbi:MAG TPA: VWA domain-containing protein [Gammaproteobacteria bacterium]|nr:VWA domain-containing protein [Gammaproteobacteria bacterium]
MIKAFLKNNKGSVAPIFAVVILTLLAGVGAAVDFTNINAKKTSYQSMADAAVLAAAKSGETDQAKLLAVAKEFVVANNALGETLNTQLNLTPSGRVRVNITGNYKMVFMGMFGKKTTPVAVVSEAPLANSEPVNIAMVLDITGSMKGSKIKSLRKSATGLITYLEGIDSDAVKVSVVPFARYVKLDKSYRSKAWLDVPPDTTSAPYKSCYWTRDNIPGTCRVVHSTCNNDGVSYPCSWTKCDKGPKYKVCKMRVDKVTWHGCVGSRDFPWNEKSKYAGHKIPGLMNTWCKSKLLPLTDDLSAVKTSISKLKAWDKTYLPGGLVWGWRTLDKNAPLTQAAGSPKGTKDVMIVMTDGKNTVSPSGSGFHTGNDVNEANTTAKNLCTKIKADKIEVFTIAYDMSDVTAKNLLKNCATDASMFYDASSAADLDQAFQEIGRRLMKLRLTH